MGAPDQLAKILFEEEIPRLFGHALSFQSGHDLGFSELRLDGVLHLASPLVLTSPLPAPWSELRPGRTVVEVKMPGDHLAPVALERAQLRRQALRVVSLERTPPIDEQVSLWMVAPHVPAWLPRAYQLHPCGAGCYQLELGPVQVLWIAANELPLDEALLPLLVARSGKKLAEFVRWSIGQRSAAWVTRVLEWSSMSPEQVRELEAELKRYGLQPGGTEEERERKRQAARLMLLVAPEVTEALQEEGKELGRQEGRQEGVQTGRLEEARRSVERVLRKRKLTLPAEQQAKLQGCTDLTTLERWHDQALDASTADEALR